MRIIFDLRKTGLGNNGGSLTLINSANVLVDLGHNVFMVDSMKNKNTWVSLKAPHLIINNENDLPNADAIIATGYKSVECTVAAPNRCGLKMHWIRAWENWQYDDNEIVQKVLNQPTIKVVNSLCLQKKLKDYGISSFIIRPGYDFDHFSPLGLREKTKYVVVGGLYREGTHGIRKRTDWLLKCGEYLKLKNKNVKFYLFGSEKDPNIKFVDKYLKSPNISDKNIFYNTCSVWLAPSMSEGLHLPPAEAMLTECSVVGTNAELSGMQDYLINEVTGLVSENNIESFFSCAQRLVESKELRDKLGAEARKKILSLGSRVDNMKKFISLIEELLNGKN